MGEQARQTEKAAGYPRSLQRQMERYQRSTFVLAIAMLVALGGFYFLVYRPAQVRLLSLNREIQSKQQTLDANRNRASNLPVVQMEVSRLEAKLHHFDKQLPPRHQIDQFMRDITQVSQESSLRKYSVVPLVPKRSELFNELPIKLNFEGDFLGVCRFLDKTEGMTRLTRVRSLNLKSKNSATGEVEVQLSMNIYFSEG